MGTLRNVRWRWCSVFVLGSILTCVWSQRNNRMGRMSSITSDYSSDLLNFASSRSRLGSGLGSSLSSSLGADFGSLGPSYTSSGSGRGLRGGLDTFNDLGASSSLSSLAKRIPDSYNAGFRDAAILSHLSRRYSNRNQDARSPRTDALMDLLRLRNNRLKSRPSLGSSVDNLSYSLGNTGSSFGRSMDPYSVSSMTNTRDTMANTIPGLSNNNLNNMNNMMSASSFRNSGSPSYSFNNNQNSMQQPQNPIVSFGQQMQGNHQQMQVGQQQMQVGQQQMQGQQQMLVGQQQMQGGQQQMHVGQQQMLVGQQQMQVGQQQMQGGQQQLQQQQLQTMQQSAQLQPQQIASNTVLTQGTTSNLVPTYVQPATSMVLQRATNLVPVVQPTPLVLQQAPQMVPLVSVATSPILQNPSPSVGFGGMRGLGSGLSFLSSGQGHMPGLGSSPLGNSIFPRMGPVIVKIEDLLPKPSESKGGSGSSNSPFQENPHPTDPRLSILKLDEGLSVVLNHSSPHKKIVNLPTPTNKEEADALKRILENMEAPDYIRDMVKFDPFALANMPPAGGMSAASIGAQMMAGAMNMANAGVSAVNAGVPAMTGPTMGTVQSPMVGQTAVQAIVGQQPAYTAPVTGGLASVPVASTAVSLGSAAMTANVAGMSSGVATGAASVPIQQNAVGVAPVAGTAVGSVQGLPATGQVQAAPAVQSVGGMAVQTPGAAVQAGIPADVQTTLGQAAVPGVPGEVAAVALTDDLSIDEILISAYTVGGMANYPLASEQPTGNFVLTALDMELTQQQFAELHGSPGVMGRFKRKAITNVKTRWPGATVPFEIQHGFSAADQQTLLNAMAQWSSSTCIKFRPAQPSDPNVLSFRSGKGCSSNVGMIGGKQFLTLQQECRIPKIVLHEIGHAIGMIHEHQREDRDNYLKINYGNIKPGGIKDFSLFKRGSVDHSYAGYDYMSIMHYGKSAFARSNGMVTMEAVDPKFTNVMGNSKSLSNSDIATVNAMYGCGGVGGGMGSYMANSPTSLNAQPVIQTPAVAASPLMQNAQTALG